MKDDVDKIQRLKDLFSVKTDEQLARVLGVSVFAVRSWKIRKILPKKYELILAKGSYLSNNTNSIVAGGNINNSGSSIYFDGDGNVFNKERNYPSIATSKNILLAEFCELYEMHHTPQIQKELLKMIDTLRSIKAVYESSK